MKANVFAAYTTDCGWDTRGCLTTLPSNKFSIAYVTLVEAILLIDNKLVWSMWVITQGDKLPRCTPLLSGTPSLPIPILTPDNLWAVFRASFTFQPPEFSIDASPSLINSDRTFIRSWSLPTSPVKESCTSASFSLIEGRDFGKAPLFLHRADESQDKLYESRRN